MQAAYDRQLPNGTARRRPGSREAIYVFRLYRKNNTPGLGAAPIGDSALSSVLNPVRKAIRDGRDFLRKGLNTLQGRVLEREYQLVLIPERFEKIPEVRTHFSYAQSGYFIDTPMRNARGITHFRISGRTHWTPAYVNGVAVDGDAALKDLCGLIDDYFYPPNGASAADFELNFLDLMAPASAEDPFGEMEWLIHPLRNGVRTSKQKGAPFLTQFTLEFAGLQSNRDKQKAEDGFLGTLAGDALANLLKSVGLDSLLSAAKDVFGVVNEVQGFASDVENVVAAGTDYIRGVNQVIVASIGKVRGLANTAEAIISRVQDGINLARNIPNLTEDELALMRRDFPGFAQSGSPDDGFILTAEVSRVRDVLLALSANPQLFAQPAVAGSATTTIRVDIGTTLEAIADRAGCTVDNLIDLNGLRHPFIDARPRPERQEQAARDRLAAAQADTELSDPTSALSRLNAQLANQTLSAEVRADLERQRAALFTRIQALQAEITDLAAAESAEAGVLYAGDTIRLPLAQQGPAPSIFEIDPVRARRITLATGVAPTEEDRLFGLDLELDDDGNLVWDPVRRDAVVERGLQHMVNVQSRYIRLPLGALRYAPGIGNFAFADLGQWQGPAKNRLLAYSIYSTLRQDPRVRNVRHVTADQYAGAASIKHDALLINGASVSEIRTPLAA